MMHDFLSEIRAELQFQYSVQLDALILFGGDSTSWSHEERCQRLSAEFNRWWGDAGGEGDHPMNRYKP